MSIAAMFAAAALALQAGSEGPAGQADAPPDVGAEAVMTPPAPADPVADGLEAYVDGVMAAYMAEAPIPGAIVAVTRPGGALMIKGYGVADLETGEPVTGEATRFEIGSISKTFVWTAVMMLEEDGRIDLQAPLNQYLQGYQAPDGERALTMADLMSHRLGAEDTLALFLPDLDALALEAALARTQPALAWSPGGATAYSNWGTALAAKVVEDVSGRAYRDFLFEEILEPLGMTDTTLREADAGEAAPPRTQSYSPEGGYVKQAFRIDQQAFAPVGAMSSTAADMTRWMGFHLNRGELDGARLLSEQTHARMQARLFPDRPEAGDMAHGFMTRPYRGQTFWGHGGYLNSFYSDMAMIEPLGLGVFISLNADATREPVLRMAELVTDHALGRARDNAPPAARLDLEAEALSAYEGRYTPNRRTHEGFEKLLTGLGVFGVSAVEGGAIDITGAGETERFWPVGGDVFENRLANTIRFERDAAGEVARFSSVNGTNTYERVSADEEPQILFASFGAAALFALTTWLGLWRRLGRGAQVTARGRAVALFDLFAAGWVFVLIAVIAMAAAGLSAGLEIVARYPTPMLTAGAVTASLAVLIAAGVVLASGPAFFGSGWSIWRKIHHGLFAAALGVLAWALVAWDLAFHLPMSA